MTQMQWTKPDFRQDQFEKDRNDCAETAKNDDSLTVADCLAEKGYERKPALTQKGLLYSVLLVLSCGLCGPDCLDSLVNDSISSGTREYE